jgi:hypothetical protein
MVDQMALKALEAVRTVSPLVLQCQKVLNDIFTQHAVGLYWVTAHAEVRRYKITNKLARDGSVRKFVGSEPSRVSRQNMSLRRIKCWMENQHLARSWQYSGIGSRIILGPSPLVKTIILLSDRIQSRVVNWSAYWA